MSNEQITLQVFSRPNCQLCGELIEELSHWQQRYCFRLKIIDITDDKELTAKYAGRIPVLTSGDIELCEYYLDSEHVREFLERIEKN